MEKIYWKVKKKDDEKCFHYWTNSFKLTAIYSTAPFQALCSALPAASIHFCSSIQTICNLPVILPAWDKTLHTESDTTGQRAWQLSVTSGQTVLLCSICKINSWQHHACVAVLEHPFRTNLENYYLSHHQHVPPILFLIWLCLLCSHVFMGILNSC